MDDSIDVTQVTQALQTLPGELQTSSTPPSSLSKDWHSDPSKFLAQACFVGNLEVVQYILTEVKEGPYLDDIKNNFENNLIWVCSKGYPDILACLLEHGAGINHCAMIAGAIEDTDTAIRIYEVLFKYGLDLVDYPGII